jgi:hypothetical protein
LKADGLELGFMLSIIVMGGTGVVMLLLIVSVVGFLLVLLALVTLLTAVSRPVGWGVSLLLTKLLMLVVLHAVA